MSTEKPKKNGGKSGERDEKGRFVKGNPGGPGRKEGSVSITTEVKRKLKQLSHDQKRTYLQLFVDQIIKEGITGNDKQARKLIWNYVDGMPKQSFDADIKLPQTLIDLIKDASNQNGGSELPKENSK